MIKKKFLNLNFNTVKIILTKPSWVQFKIQKQTDIEGIKTIKLHFSNECVYLYHSVATMNRNQ